MLSEVRVRQAKASEKPRKLADAPGLYLLITPNGGKWWRFKYRFGGKAQGLSMGVYPDVSLKLARERRDAARALLVQGINPSEDRKVAKARAAAAESQSSAAVAREWFEKFSPNWAPAHARNVIRQLERDVFPWLGSKPVREIEAPQLLGVLRQVEARGYLTTAHRIKQTCGGIFRYAIATCRASRDPSADLRGALPPATRRHYGALTDPAEVGALMRAIAAYRGSFIVCSALRLAPLLFVRPGELRRAEWAELDLDGAIWRIPANSAARST